MAGSEKRVTPVTPGTMRAAYEFLRSVSFIGLRLPKAGSVTFVPKRLRGYHGFYVFPDHIIVVDTHTPDLTRLLQIMAHEMTHAALEQNAACDHADHDEHFNELARIIEYEMGWPKGAI